MRRFSCKHTYHFTYSDSLSSIFFHLIMWSIFKSSRRISSIYSFWLQAVIRSHCLPGFTLSKLFFFLSNGFLLVNLWPVITLFKDAVIEIKMKPVIWNYPPLSLSLWHWAATSYLSMAILQIQGKFYLRIDQLGEGAKWRRTVGQEIYSPLLLAFTEQVKEKSWLDLVP